MRGKQCLYSLLVALAVLLAPVGVTAQTCEYHPADPSMFITIDGDLYAYQPIEDNRKILKRLLLAEQLELKVDGLETKLEILEGNATLRIDTIALMTDQREADRQLIRSLTIEASKDLPLFKKPVTNFILGVALSGALFTFWSFADSQ
jgi:hypothetical protein